MSRDDDKIEISCDICDSKFLIKEYGWGRCPNCGTAHQWDESYAPLLSEDQISILRKHAEETKAKEPPAAQPDERSESEQ